MSTPRLDEIEANGTCRNLPEQALPDYDPSSEIVCADGTRLSVIAGPGTYCSPRPALIPGYQGAHEANPYYAGPYTAVEVMFRTGAGDLPDWWPEHDPDGVDGWVPVRLVRDYIESRGGEAVPV